MMIDETTALTKRYDALLEREHQAQIEHEERQQRLTSEMVAALLNGGSVRHLNAAGQPVETTAEQCMADADPAELLALLRETEKALGVPMTLRIRIGGLFAKLAADFGEYAAENAR